MNSTIDPSHVSCKDDICNCLIQYTGELCDVNILDLPFNVSSLILGQTLAFLTVVQLVVFSGYGIYKRIWIDRIPPFKLTLIAVYVMIVSLGAKSVFWWDPFGYYDIVPAFVVNAMYWVNTMLTLICTLMTISVWCSVLYSTKSAKTLSLAIPRILTGIAALLCIVALSFSLIIGVMKNDHFLIRNICVSTVLFMVLAVIIILSIFLPLTIPVLKENIPKHKIIDRSFKYLKIILLSSIFNLLFTLLGVGWRIVTSTHSPIYSYGFTVISIAILFEQLVTQNAVLFLLIDPFSTSTSTHSRTGASRSKDRARQKSINLAERRQTNR